MPHEDGAAYHPVVATVSLGATIVLNVTEKHDGQSHAEHETHVKDKKTWRILQEPRSLLLTTGSAYKDTLHGIAEIVEDVDLNAETVANWDLLNERSHETISTNGNKNERSTTRISLTFRDVVKVSDIGSKIFGKRR